MVATASIAQAAVAKPVAFDVGDEHACISSSCGRTQCWGGPNNTFGESADRVGQATDVAVGMDHTCTLSAAGKVTCWGRNTNGLLQPPLNKTYRDIEAGQFHTCGIQSNNNEISCWGWPGAAVTDVRPQTSYRQLDAGADYSCAVTSGRNAIDCWGDGVPGGVVRLLSWDVLEGHDLPFGVPERFERVAVGDAHICWTTTAQKLYCLGDNNDAGQLAPGNDGNPESPAGELVYVVELDGFATHSEWSEFSLFGPLIYKHGGVQYFE